MRNLAQLTLLPAAIVLAVAAIPGAVHAAETKTIPFTPDRWTLGEGIKVVEHRGVQAIEIPQAQERLQAILKDLVFTDGTIELDVESTAGMGPSVGFRRRDAKDLELFYLRPRPTCAQEPDCVQYAPFVKGVLLWDILPALQKPARYLPGQWNHLKLVVSGRRLKVWVNGGEPALDVAKLEGETTEGGIVLMGPGFLANVKVTPGAVEGLSPKAGPDPTAKDARLVRAWSISPVVKLATGAAPDVATRPTAKADWTPMPAETGGLVNISRRYGLPEGRSLVWLRTTIKRQGEGREARGHRLERRGVGVRQRQAGLRRRERLLEAGAAQEAGRAPLARQWQPSRCRSRPATTRWWWVSPTRSSAGA